MLICCLLVVRSQGFCATTHIIKGLVGFSTSNSCTILLLSYTNTKQCCERHNAGSTSLPITIVRYQQHAIVSKPGDNEGRFRQPLPSLFTAADIIVGRYLLLIVVVLALSRSRIVGTTPQIRQRPLMESPRKHWTAPPPIIDITQHTNPIGRRRTRPRWRRMKMQFILTWRKLWLLSFCEAGQEMVG